MVNLHPVEISVLSPLIAIIPLKTKVTEVGSRGWGRRSRSKHCLGSASYCPVPCHQSQLQDGRNKDKTKNKGKKNFQNCD